MPPTLADRLVHIRDAIRNIESFLAGKTLADFSGDLFLRLVIERSFEIISEASRRIPDDVKERHRDINWKGMAALGNRLRHAYHRIEPEILWEIAKRDLPPLGAFAEQTMQDEQC